ncbi:uncharacterized protein PHACADRAFT_208474 [Phanerochaete carnosa HHB-10118-sp]|uniref:MYND-type domain-containing protein n=1 Tax=Phanerochaete carnosa (strain HHB-10118-sp) TaxID=650164 RepID=K5VTV6_PHACS|nr:uncharacterized protein PHACADRAFT_208474 [Phanerochaete carnosa HHB-10118-sp]EKM54928.1 hypothetical protein PHACADRAFT_208474 [Phanerochaete carnosa HHB-10118-sp]
MASALPSSSNSTPGSSALPRICHATAFTLGPNSSCKEKLVLGSKGPMWFLLYANQGKRMYTPLNILWPSDPFPEPSPDGRARIAFTSPQGLSLLSNLLEARIPPLGATRVEDPPMHAIVKPTGRMFDKDVPEIEILLDELEIVHGCTLCGRWETTGAPNFKCCSSCKSRYYCSVQCQRTDWLMRHKSICALLKQGKLQEAEKEELMAPMSTFTWRFRNALNALKSEANDVLASTYQETAANPADRDDVANSRQAGDKEEDKGDEPCVEDEDEVYSDDGESVWEDISEEEGEEEDGVSSSSSRSSGSR